MSTLKQPTPNRLKRDGGTPWPKEGPLLVLTARDLLTLGKRVRITKVKIVTSSPPTPAAIDKEN